MNNELKTQFEELLEDYLEDFFDDLFVGRNEDEEDEDNMTERIKPIEMELKHVLQFPDGKLYRVGLIEVENPTKKKEDEKHSTNSSSIEELITPLQL